MRTYIYCRGAENIQLSSEENKILTPAKYRTYIDKKESAVREARYSSSTAAWGQTAQSASLAIPS